MDTGYAKQEEANLGCTTRPIHKNNAGGDPVHILTMRYKDNDAGHDLKYSDDRTKWRGEMRREKIWQKQQSQDHNIITGAPTMKPVAVPPEPRRDTYRPTAPWDK